MKKLTSNTAFGDYLNTKNIPDCEYRYLRSKFDELLKQPLELWQFVPCKLVDGVWVVLEEPCLYCFDACDIDKCLEYQEAKERYLFDGFEVIVSENPDVYGVLLYGDDTIYPDDFKTIE